MATLPTDIIVDILSRLPVKPLSRFKCVCKPWNSLIKSPKFIKLHLNQTLISDSDRHLLLLTIDQHPSLYSSELDLRPNHLSFSKLHHPLNPGLPIQVVGICNGVVCIINITKTNVVLYNPLTKSHRKLPQNQFPNPEFNKMLFGFGYDSKNDDYKVLRIVQGLGRINDSANKAQVYSLNNNSWKSIQGIPYELYYGFYDGVLVNEALHYVVTNSECLSIASFDLQTEDFSCIECPNNDKLYTNTVFILTELGGCLCLLVSYNTSDELGFNDLDDAQVDVSIVEHVDLWVMKEYGNKDSWAKLFRICQTEISWCYILMRPIVYSKDGRRILLQIDNSGYCWYDLGSKYVERVTALGMPTGPSVVFKTGSFVGSLVSLEDKVNSERESLPRKNKEKNDLHNFLSKGFKLRL